MAIRGVRRPLQNKWKCCHTLQNVCKLECSSELYHYITEITTSSVLHLIIACLHDVKMFSLVAILTGFQRKSAVLCQ